MLKRLLLITALFAATSSYGQDSLRKCRLDQSTMLKLVVSSESDALIIPPSFPSGAIETCGKYSVYYADVAYSRNAGFSDPTYGSARRSTLCAVLTYMQSVLDYSNVPAGGIRLYVDSSYSSGFHSTFYFPGQAGPYSDTSSLTPPAVVNGFVHDYIISGTDPSSAHFHAWMQMNFDSLMDNRLGLLFPFTRKVAANEAYNNGLDTTANCQVDLFSAMLHLQTHTLGWFTWLNPYHGGTSTTSWRTSIDTSIYLMHWQGRLIKYFSEGKLYCYRYVLFKNMYFNFHCLYFEVSKYLMTHHALINIIKT